MDAPASPSPDAPRHDSPHDDALAAAVRAAHRAAALIRDQAGELRNLRRKGTNDFVTATDEAAQSVIVETLREAFPDYAVLAEEGPDGTVAPVADGFRWIIDPIDGTTNFIQQVPPYAVSIGLQHGDALVAGVVLDVTHDELFTAVKNHGLHVNGAPAGVSKTDALSDAFLATGFPYRRFEHTEVYLEVLGTLLPATRGIRRHGSAAVDLARLACGRFDGFFETGLRPWDVAAGTLLVREGGGRVTDYRGTDGLDPVFQQQLCATNGALHEALRDCLTPMHDIRL